MIKTVSLFAGACVIALGVAGVASVAQGAAQAMIGICHFNAHDGDRAVAKIPNPTQQGKCEGRGGEWLVLGCPAAKGHKKEFTNKRVEQKCASLQGSGG